MGGDGMDPGIFDMGDIDIAWCPGCGNFMIHQTVKEVLAELELDPTETVLVSGIGQAGRWRDGNRARSSVRYRPLPSPSW